MITGTGGEAGEVTVVDEEGGTAGEMTGTGGTAPAAGYDKIAEVLVLTSSEKLLQVRDMVWCYCYVKLLNLSKH